MRLIDADALIDDIRKNSESYFADDFAHEWVDKQPTVQPDLSEYSDKLWKNAYERGKAEAKAEQIRCRDCKYWRDDHTCHEHSLVSPMCANEYCSRAERRNNDL